MLAENEQNAFISISELFGLLVCFDKTTKK